MKPLLTLLLLVLLLDASVSGQNGNDDGLATAMRQLKESIDRLTPVRDSSWYSRVEADIATLRLEISHLTGTQGKNDTDQSLWLEMASQLAALRSQVQLLEESIDGQRTQLASLGDEAGVVIPLHERISGLADQVEAILKRKASDSLLSKTSPNEVALSGFVDGSNYANFSTGRSTFGLDQVEVDLRKSLSSKTSVRADIEGLNDGVGEIKLGVEQGFMSWRSGDTWSLQFTFGKFNAPIGFEALDPVDMFQYSRGLVGTYCTPSNLTGIMATVSTPKVVDWSMYVVNGWDVNSDNNKGKTLGTRMALHPSADMTVGLSAISGSEIADNSSSRRSVLDGDLTYHLTTWWLMGAEVNLGWESKVLGDTATADWQGLLLMSNVQFLGRYGLTIRGDYLNDADGNRTGTPQELKAVCISPSLKISEGLTTLFEARYDWSNRGVFDAADGAHRKNQVVMAFEFTYAF